MNVDEIAILLNLEIPDALFTKPKLIAEIKVPEKAVSQEQITAEDLMSGHIFESDE
jgi:hypothetical protein